MQQQDGDFVALRIEGAASVRVVGETRRGLLDALESARPVRLDLGAASSVDAAFLQLVSSATGAFAAAGVELEVSDPHGLIVRAFARR